MISGRFSELSVASALTVAAALLLIAFGTYVLVTLRHLPSPDLAAQPPLAQATIVMSADGHELGRFFRENRRWISYRSMSPSVIHALLAAEDHRFFAHRGVDVRRLAGAGWRTLGGDVQGGSTITMQLARNRFDEIGTEVSLHRKLREILLAYRIERRYTKHQVLEAYLNTVPFGYNTFGIEAAANLYFDKPAEDLNAAEAATLVGQLKATTRYNPVLHPDRALTRRNVVLSRMADVGYLTSPEAERLRREPLNLDFTPAMLGGGKAPYFLAHIRRSLEDWATARGYDLYRDGLRVHTTLDLRLQRVAEAAVAEQTRLLQAVAAYEWNAPHPRLFSTEASSYPEGHEFSYLWQRHPDLLDQQMRRTRAFQERVRLGADPLVAAAQLKGRPAFVDSLRRSITQLQAGLVALDPSDGQIKAWVGGRDFATDQFDKVDQAMRQPGSTFKPFVYAAAMEAGMTPWHVLQDSAMAYTVGRRTWQPYNAGGGYSGRMITLRDALVRSKNTVTAQLIHWLGPERVSRLAHEMGIRSELRNVPSLALGTSEVTLLEMTGAYTTFTNHGRPVAPMAVTRIEEPSGRVVAQFAPEASTALSHRTAVHMLSILRGVTQAGGTGARIRSYLGPSVDLAGKTGTTQNGTDGWFLLMHPDLIAGAWVGFNDQRITFRTNFWGQGAHNALHVVGAFAQGARNEGLAYRSNRRFRVPGHAPTPDPLQYADVPSEYEDAQAIATRRAAGPFTNAADGRAIGDDVGRATSRTERRRAVSRISW